MATVPQTRNWWTAKKGDVHTVTLPYVRTVENYQAELFNKFIKLEATYDTNPRTNRHSMGTVAGYAMGRAKAVVTENIIASTVDAVAANVADQDIRVRIQTDGADWSHQRTAKRLEMYLDGLGKLFEVTEKCRTGFKAGAAMKGTGLNKVWIDQFDQIRVAPVPVDNIVVDEIEARDGKPRQLHYRDFFDKEDLKAQFPEYADAIDKAQTSGNWRLWAGYRPLQPNDVVVVESWRLPIGPKGHKNYIPGRHTLTIDGCDLLDEEYHKPFFPFAKMVWNAPIWGFYGISLAERLLPFQNLLNRRNYQINRSLDLKADPVTYVNQADQNLAVKTVNQIGAIAVYKTAIPQTVDHQAVGIETYQDLDRIRGAAARQAMVDKGMQTGSVPAGIESGEGVREVRNSQTQPFSMQEKAFERFYLDTLWLILDCCKDLGGTKAPEILKVTKYGNERIKWSEVDMDDLRIEMSAASTLADTPAGRRQRATELAQSGAITMDEYRELLDLPDIEAKITMYTAASEKIEWVIEQIERGRDDLTPLPFDNLDMSVRMCQREIERISVIPGVPDEVIEALGDYAAMCAGMLNPPAPPGAMAPGAMPPGGPMPPAPAGPGPLTSQTSASAPAFAPGAFAPMTA